MKLRFIINNHTFICKRIPVIPNGIFVVLTTRKWDFCLYFSSIHYYWHSISRNSSVHNSWSEMERCKKRDFQLLKMRIMIISWNININMYLTFSWVLGLRVLKIILIIRDGQIKVKRLPKFQFKKWEFENFLFRHNRVFKHKYIVSNQHVSTNDIGKMWASYIFHFSTRMQTSTQKK